MMLKKSIKAYGRSLVIACDGRCDKAWGINGRPRTLLSDTNPDDYVYQGDDELGTAPGPGSTRGLSEGGDLKPSASLLTDGERMNKWCFRECERCDSFEVGQEIRLRDMRRPKPNIRARAS